MGYTARKLKEHGNYKLHNCPYRLCRVYWRRRISLMGNKKKFLTSSFFLKSFFFFKYCNYNTFGNNLPRELVPRRHQSTDLLYRSVGWLHYDASFFSFFLLRGFFPNRIWYVFQALCNLYILFRICGVWFFMLIRIF